MGVQVQALDSYNMVSIHYEQKNLIWAVPRRSSPSPKTRFVSSVALISVALKLTSNILAPQTDLSSVIDFLTLSCIKEDKSTDSLGFKVLPLFLTHSTPTLLFYM